MHYARIPVQRVDGTFLRVIRVPRTYAAPRGSRCTCADCCTGLRSRSLEPREVERELSQR